MAEFLFGAACFILTVVAIGLARILRGAGDPDRVMATQLLGTGGVSVVLIFAIVSAQPAMIDAALILALLAAFAGLAFVRAAGRERGE